jgi:hypothetical protein
MRVLVALLDYSRHTFTKQVVEHNSAKAGCGFDMATIDEYGIARALNVAMEQAEHYDALFTMSNDILMPEGWLAKAVEAAEAIPETGCAALYTVQDLHSENAIGGVKVYPGEIVFGNALYPRLALTSVGHFNEDFDPYGMQDSDWCFRAHAMGFTNYYVDAPRSEHIGHDVGQNSEYRRMKDAGLQKCGEVWKNAQRGYAETGDYSIFYQGYKWPNIDANVNL